MMALDVGPGDQVILPSYTFFATAGAVWRLGARPVFVDILPDDYNLDPDQLEAAITPATKAVIPVHLFGQCADMDAIREITNRHGLAVVEDAAQSLGAQYRGRRAGSLGDVGCFSFYPTKNLGGLGDAGMLTTDSDEMADKLRLLRGHGMRPRYYHKVVGVNSRLDSIQAAALRVKLAHLDEWSQTRAQNAERYYELFCEYGLEQKLGLPSESSDKNHVWNQYHRACTRRTTRRPSRASGKRRHRLGGLLPRVTAPTRVLCDIGLQAGQSASDGTGDTRNDRVTDFARADNRAATARGC